MVNAKKKRANLLPNFKFLHNYLTETQFIKAVSAHFYGVVLYACSICTIALRDAKKINLYLFISDF